MERIGEPMPLSIFVYRLPVSVLRGPLKTEKFSKILHKARVPIGQSFDFSNSII